MARRADEKARAATVFLYTTFPDAETAERIGAGLVEARLAACVNLLPGMRSIFRWQGQLEHADEIVMIVKTLASREAAVIEAIRAAHPYEVPAIVTLPNLGGFAPYLDWIAENAKPG
ncbi:MAG: divalent-cation tolerance protein CutA [Bauldia sp.]|nr:divalent-cation tolerance protein CutA [Bauldia sp.]